MNKRTTTWPRRLRLYPRFIRFLRLTFAGLQVVLLQSGLLLRITFVILVPLLLDLFEQQEHLAFITTSQFNGFQAITRNRLYILFIFLLKNNFLNSVKI